MSSPSRTIGTGWLRSGRSSGTLGQVHAAAAHHPDAGRVDEHADPPAVELRLDDPAGERTRSPAVGEHRVDVGGGHGSQDPSPCNASGHVGGDVSNEYEKPSTRTA